MGCVKSAPEVNDSNDSNNFRNSNRKDIKWLFLKIEKKDDRKFNSEEPDLIGNYNIIFLSQDRLQRRWIREWSDESAEMEKAAAVVAATATRTAGTTANRAAATSKAETTREKQRASAIYGWQKNLSWVRGSLKQNMIDLSGRARQSGQASKRRL